MVLQGTVWGPILWNLFYEDARFAINKHGFNEIVFADDLNALRVYPGQCADVEVMADVKVCQDELHTWGRANQVEFAPGKESSHILLRTRPHGEDFRILGVDFDCKLVMSRKWSMEAPFNIAYAAFLEWPAAP